MALLYFDTETDVWLVEHESCERLHREIMTLLNERGRLGRSSEGYTSRSASIRIRLKQYNTQVEELRTKLSFLNNITAEENERRHRMIENLQSKGVQLENKFHDKRDVMERKELMGWVDDDEKLLSTSSTVSIQEMREEQNRRFEEQENGLENLSQIISRNKNIAQSINDETTAQIDIVDDIVQRVDRTNTRVQSGTNRVVVVTRADNTCGYWVVILALFAAIVTITLLP